MGFFKDMSSGQMHPAGCNVPSTDVAPASSWLSARSHDSSQMASELNSLRPTVFMNALRTRAFYSVRERGTLPHK